MRVFGGRRLPNACTSFNCFRALSSFVYQSAMEMQGDEPRTCLSTSHHDGFADGIVKDHIIHFFGCLKFKERHAFFATIPLHPYWQGEYERLKHRPLLTTQSGTLLALIDTMIRWASSIHREAERYESLRGIFEKDVDGKHLTAVLNKSREDWKGPDDESKFLKCPDDYRPEAKTIKSWCDSLDTKRTSV